jgi:hypothetical protein
MNVSRINHFHPGGNKRGGGFAAGFGTEHRAQSTEHRAQKLTTHISQLIAFYQLLT